VSVAARGMEAVVEVLEAALSDGFCSQCWKAHAGWYRTRVWLVCHPQQSYP
jgi:hypothetical protein